MVNDPSSTVVGALRTNKHFDNYTDKFRLVPYPDGNIGGNNTPTEYDNMRISQIGYANSQFFGLGVQTGTTKPAIYVKTNPGDQWVIGSITGDYAALTNLGSDAVIFTYYQKKWYGIDATGWWSYGPVDSSPTWARGINNTLFTTMVCPPIVHSKDDIMYAAGSNTIVTNNSGSWNNSALVLPNDHTIVSLAEYGNYLAIACNRTNDTNVIYLWDRDSSVSTLSEKIDSGTGTIRFIENLGGVLIWVTLLQSSTLSILPRVAFKYYTGASVVTFQEYTSTLATIPAQRQKYNNLVYFMGDITLNGVAFKGIWKIVKDPSGRMKVSFDRQLYLDNVIDANSMLGLVRIGDYFQVSFKFGGLYKVSNTNNSYTTSCTAETPTLNAGDSAMTKTFIGASVTVEALPSGASIALAYRKDAQSAWTNIFTETTLNTIRRSENNSSAQVGDFKEIQFQIISMGGTIPTGIKYRCETKDDDKY